MVTLVHGTTRFRAEQIIKNGPNPRYREPGGVPSNDGFSMYVEGGPYIYGTPEDYAKGKAAQCPQEGGPVILVIEDVPDDALSAANLYNLSPLRHGVVQFDYGAGLEELLAVWEQLPKTIRDV
jgi:hypothetical protein